MGQARRAGTGLRLHGCASDCTQAGAHAHVCLRIAVAPETLSSTDATRRLTRGALHSISLQVAPGSSMRWSSPGRERCLPSTFRVRCAWTTTRLRTERRSRRDPEPVAMIPGILAIFPPAHTLPDSTSRSRCANVIDTADIYGAGLANRLIADALYPYPENLICLQRM